MNRIQSFQAITEEEKIEKELFLNWIEEEPKILFRECQRAHISSSSIIFNKDYTKILMIYHNIFKSWSIPGGHADGASDLLEIAKKEAFEETGITDLTLMTDEIVSLDTMPVYAHYKNNKFVPAHLHLNATFAFVADEKQSLILNEEETGGVAWILIEEIADYCNEPPILEIYLKTIEKVKNTILLK